MSDKIDIVLPRKIPILRDKKNQDLLTDTEEYSVYYENIIYPYREDYDIQIDCAVGKNLGNCWRIDSFDGVSGAYDFTLKIYGYRGELLASKACVIEIYEKKPHRDITLLCIGDSLTQREEYIRHTVRKIRNVKTIGLRKIAGDVSHEGRGGWTSHKYFEVCEDDGWSVSPFLFPRTCGGSEYFGSEKFWNTVAASDSCDKYSYMGTDAQYIKEGMLCLRDGSLWRYKDGKYINEEKNPVFEFSFSKYMERYGFDRPDAVSLLFGANEFQYCPYERSETEIKRYIGSLKKMVQSVKEYDSAINVIINLPICGGDQYSWGMKLGCGSSVKQYNYCIKTASLAILDEFDGRESEGIYVCPMLAVCDTVSGFPWEHVKANIYSDMDLVHCTNWVHPSEVGYRQMGDALAGVVAEVIENI